LHFSTRHRSKRRRQRIALVLWVTAVLGAAGGIPGSNTGLDALARLTGLGKGERGVDTSQSVASATKFRRQVFAQRPDPTPSPSLLVTTPVADAPAPAIAAPPPVASGSIASIIVAAAAEYGADPNYLLSIASCESGLNPSAYNPAGYYGLFQFAPGTWASNGYGSIWDPVAQARTAARMIAGGQASAWGCA
jgi:hypothetical protein